MRNLFHQWVYIPEWNAFSFFCFDSALEKAQFQELCEDADDYQIILDIYVDTLVDSRNAYISMDFFFATLALVSFMLVLSIGAIAYLAAKLTMKKEP